MPVDLTTLSRAIVDLAATPGAGMVEVEGDAFDGARRAGRFKVALLPPDWVHAQARLRDHGVHPPVDVAGLALTGAVLWAQVTADGGRPDRAAVLDLVRRLRRGSGLKDFLFRVACTSVEVNESRVTYRIASQGLLFPGP